MNQENNIDELDKMLKQLKNKKQFEDTGLA